MNKRKVLLLRKSILRHLGTTLLSFSSFWVLLLSDDLNVSEN